MLIQQRFSLMKQRNTEVILKLLSNVVGDSYDQIVFPHKLLLTNTYVSRLRKPFASN